MPSVASAQAPQTARQGMYMTKRGDVLMVCFLGSDVNQDVPIVNVGVDLTCICALGNAAAVGDGAAGGC